MLFMLFKTDYNTSLPQYASNCYSSHTAKQKQTRYKNVPWYARLTLYTRTAETK